MKKTVKTIYDSAAEPGGSHYVNRGSLRGSGKIRKRIILGEKFDYGEKAKEKKNYVLYVSGQGQEKKEIEEMEEITGRTKKNEKIVEEKEIIDNYQYHETKDIKKKHRKNGETHHQRLCSPFERTKIKKYATYTSEPRQSGYKVIKTTDLVNRKDYSMNYRPKNKYNLSHSKISSTTSVNKEENNSHVYETYKPNSKRKNSTISTNSINRTQRATSFAGKTSTINNNKTKTKINGRKNISHIEFNYSKPKPSFCPQQVINYEYQESTIDSQPSYGQSSLNFGNRKSHTTLDTEYSYKMSTIQNKKNSKIPVSTNRIKFGSQTKAQKKLIEGPKYQYKAADRPRSQNYPRKREVHRQKKIIREIKEYNYYKGYNTNSNKGYIPFGGHGTKVGQGSLVGKIPKPTQKPSYVRNLKNFEENAISKKYERNNSYTNLSHTTESSSQVNTKIVNDSNKENVSLNQVTKEFKANPKIFPGIGVRVGGSNEIYNDGLNTDLVSVSFSEYTKYKQKNKKDENNEKCNEASLCYRGDQDEMFKEVMCPIHGKRMVKMHN